MWCSVLDMPVGSVLRQVIEETAAQVAAMLIAEGIDEELPDTVLLKRARAWLNLREQSNDRHPPP